MANYEIYEANGTTPISSPVATPQPLYASWESAEIGAFADGTPRQSAYRRVEWRFGPLSANQYQALIANRPANGKVAFKTFRQAVGATAAQWVKCAGVMGPVSSGVLRDGMYLGVSVAFTRVLVV